MKKSTKLLFSSGMNNLNLGLQPASIQEDQKVRSSQTKKDFSMEASLCISSTAPHYKAKKSVKHSKQINIKRSIAHKILFIGCIQGIFGLHQAYATTYYVSPTGSDTNPGTALSSPVKSIRQALNKAQSSGDIIYVTTGTYVEAISISQSGITLSAYQDNKPVIDGGGSYPSGDWGSLVNVDGNNNTISGFEVKNSNSNGAHIAGYGVQVAGHNNTISKMNVHHTWSNGILLNGDYNTAEDSIVWQTNQENAHNTGAGWGSGLTAARNNRPEALKKGITSYATIRRNTVYNNWGEGLSCYEVDHCTVEDNTVYDNYAVNLYLSDATNSVVQRNLVYVSPSPAITIANRTGITLADEVSSVPRSTNNKVINNFIYNATLDAFSWTIVPQSGLNNVLIANNTIVDGGLATGVGGGANLTNTNSQIRNNIIIGQKSSVSSNNGITFSHNNWSATPSAAAASTNITGDPQVARTGSTTPGALTSAYFKVSGSSPVINAAMPLSTVTNDFFQSNRGTAPDIGGHEYGASGGTTNPSDTTAPSTPSGLGATAGSATQVNLIWNASTDNVGVTGYKIYRNGTEIQSSTATSFTDSTVVGGTSYSYTVKAYDAAGNLSSASNTATVNTPQATSGVNISSYSAGSITANSAKINWTTNTPSTGVVSYGTSAGNLSSQVSAGNAATSQSVQINGLSSGTVYYYKVSAGTAAITSSFTTSGSSSSGTVTNIAPSASVTASSESVWNNQQAIKAIDGVVAGYPADSTREWATNGEKAGAWIQLNWNAPRTVSKVVLFDRPNTNDQITSATLTFSNGSTVSVGALDNAGGAVTVNFAPVVTSSVKVIVKTVSGSTVNVGLSELQVFGF